MAESSSPHILALGPDSCPFRFVVGTLTSAGHRVTVMGPPTDGTAARHEPPPDLIVLEYDWAPDTRSREVLALLGIEGPVSPIPIVVCCQGLGFANESHGALATAGIDIMVHPVAASRLLETVSRRLRTASRHP